jgi:hypothetical protein
MQINFEKILFAVEVFKSDVSLYIMKIYIDRRDFLILGFHRC